MNNINIRKIVCLETEEEIARLRAEQHRHEYSGMCQSLLRNHLWREIVVIASPENIKVNLGSIDEDGARGNSINIRYTCRKFTITWPDLADVDGLESLVKFETLVVAREVLKILANLRTVASAAQDVLAV